MGDGSPAATAGMMIRSLQSASNGSVVPGVPEPAASSVGAAILVTAAPAPVVYDLR